MNNNSRFDEAGEAESEDQTQDGSSYNNTYPGHYGSNASEGSTGMWFIDTSCGRFWHHIHSPDGLTIQLGTPI